MKISFHGAARGVTGSCHLVECNGQKILIDCGMFQGNRELREDNAEPFGFEPSEIDYLLLTHAHLDHCGRIPLLTKRGFRGEIVTTAASKELARLIMMDSARLQEEDADYQTRKAERANKNIEIQPLYTVLDAMNSLDRFGRTAVYGQRLALDGGIFATFIDAGHILGSASIYIESTEGIHPRTVLFSGDLGNSDRPLLRDPEVPMHADVVVMESTYGNRLHKPLQPSVEELYDAVSETLQRGGNVIIPTFAVERAQELLFYLHDGVVDKRLPADMRVFLDSPMAISATEIFERHPEGYKDEAQEYFVGDRDPFSVPGLQMVRETAASKALNDLKGGAVIMAGSGMCTGGRIRHHLKRDLRRKEASILFVGFATKGTLARSIIDGAERVRIYGEKVNVRAQIYTIGGFSAHADQAELLAWHRETGAKKTFLVHGDEDVMTEFSSHLQNTEVVMPHMHEAFKL